MKINLKGQSIITRHKSWRGLLIGFLFFCIPVLVSAQKQSKPHPTTIWKLDDPSLVGGFTTTILGAPQVTREKTGTALTFDGKDDGVIVPAIPVAGWNQFTVEVLFNPDADGPVDPRFVHFEDTAGNRCTIEARITPNGMWYADTFLKNGQTNQRRTLIDSTKLHLCNQWYWVALVYDGEKMSHYINAVKELEGKMELPPFTIGKLSLGVRLNQVNWFKGQIREIRFHPSAQEKEALQRL